MGSEMCIRDRLIAGRVGDLLLGEDGVRDLLLKIAVRRKLLKIDVQHGRLAVLAVIGLDIADAAQHTRNTQQLHRRQAAAAVSALEAGCHGLQLMEARRAHGGHAIGGEEMLLYQALVQVLLMTGIWDDDPPSDADQRLQDTTTEDDQLEIAMRKALEEAL